jgi:hypothetical protein
MSLTEGLGPSMLVNLNAARDAGSRLSRAISQAVVDELDKGTLTPIEAWTVAVGAVGAIGRKFGMSAPAQLDAIRSSFAQMAKMGIL